MSLEHTSALLNGKYRLHEIAEIGGREPMIASAVRQGHLIIYYVEKGARCDRLFEYDCGKKIKKFLTSPLTIVSMAVAERVFAVFADRDSGTQVVAEVVN